MGNEGGSKEVVLGAPESVSEQVFGGIETNLGDEGKSEKNEMPIMPTAETTPVVLPPTAPEINSIGSTDMDDGDTPVVGRDAERMPKEYAKHLVGIVRKYKKEPHKLQSAVTSLKWDYMGKAFNRKLGDGLDGRAAA